MAKDVPPRDRRRASPDGEDATRPISALLVEDDAMVGHAFGYILRSRGYAVEGPIATLTEALAAARTTAIDVALIDVEIRGGTGWEVAMVLRERGIPFCFTSASPELANPRPRSPVRRVC